MFIDSLQKSDKSKVVSEFAILAQQEAKIAAYKKNLIFLRYNFSQFRTKNLSYETNK